MSTDRATLWTQICCWSHALNLCQLIEPHCGYRPIARIMLWMYVNRYSHAVNVGQPLELRYRCLSTTRSTLWMSVARVNNLLGCENPRPTTAKSTSLDRVNPPFRSRLTCSFVPAHILRPVFTIIALFLI
ncbi:hypothetical protein J6590_008181 [Homalodisca vitripennis]|nr:hypothetical protein J6590_008181 [Homalodisca vitripennis]